MGTPNLASNFQNGAIFSFETMFKTPRCSFADFVPKAWLSPLTGCMRNAFVCVIALHRSETENGLQENSGSYMRARFGNIAAGQGFCRPLLHALAPWAAAANVLQPSCGLFRP